MADVETETATAPAPTTPKKAAKGKSGSAAKKPRAKPSHPKTADMVNAAIKDLKERGGSSLQAIKKYISSNYKVDAEKMAPFIRKYLKSAVTSGSLVQTKGKGASGSFKMPGAPGEKGAAVKTKAKVSKPKSPKAKKAKAVKKPSSPKKAAVKKAASAPAVATKAKPSASKAKTAKSPTKKPKAPKPKKATPKKAAKKAPKKK